MPDGVVSVDGAALEQLVLALDRSAVLKKLHEEAIIELNGH